MPAELAWAHRPFEAHVPKGTDRVINQSQMAWYLATGLGW